MGSNVSFGIFLLQIVFFAVSTGSTFKVLASEGSSREVGERIEAAVHATRFSAPSIAREWVIDLIANHPTKYFGLANNKYFRIDVVELEIGLFPNDEYLEGTRGLIEPTCGTPSAVKAEPIKDERGNVIGATVSLPPLGVLYRTGVPGISLDHVAFVSHEVRHADQMARAIYGSHTDSPDVFVMENDAQRIENQFTGHNLVYFEEPGVFGNKHKPDGTFYDSKGDLKQARDGGASQKESCSHQ